MFNKIMICSDGSNCALNAVRVGAVVARHFGAEVLALNVFQPPYVEADSMRGWVIANDQNFIDRIAQYQKDAIEKQVVPLCKPLNIPCRVKQDRGHPVDGILRMAEEEKVDLIVLGSRGLRGVKEFFLGSVSSGVLHHAACPVLIARGAPLPCGTGEFQHILLASDGSECAQKAAVVAVDMVQKFATSLTVLNVCADITSVSLPGEDNAPTSDVDAELYAQHLLEHVKQNVSDLAKEKGIYCSYHQEVGHPDETIVRFADQQSADLIVLGNRGVGGFARMLVGSVSNHVTHHASCSVLVVR